MMRRSTQVHGYLSRARVRLDRRFLWSALAVLVLVVTPSVLKADDEELAGTVWTAQAGELFTDESLQINQFIPNDITIVEGDTIVWERLMFHTITLLSGEPRIPWLQPLKDGRLGILPKVGFASGIQHRTETEPISIASWARDRLGLLEPSKEKLVVNGNNEYDGTGFFNSGAPFDPGFLPRPVSVKFTQAGVYQVVCLIHPNMQATVTVLQDGFTAPESQADLDARAASERTSLIAHAESLFAASKEAGSQRKADFTMEHRLKTGLFQDDVEYARYFPDDLEVSAGDTVTWDWVNGGDTPHTVTFLSGAEAPEYLLVEHKVFADGSLNVRDPPTIAVNSEVFEPSGGDTYSGSGVFNSGVLFGEQGPPGRPTTYSLRFDTPGAYHYHCLMHGPVMSGTITVTGAALAPELPSVGDDSVPVLVGIAAAASALLICGGVLVVRWRRAAANTSSSSIENKTWRGT
jgi:plastocyanin